MTTTRADKIRWLSYHIERYFLEKPGGVIDKQKLLANFALENASSVRVGKEILELFEQVGTINIRDEDISNGAAVSEKA